MRKLYAVWQKVPKKGIKKPYTAAKNKHLCIDRKEVGCYIGGMKKEGENVMKKAMKKPISAALAAAMAVSLIPASALASGLSLIHI